MMSPDFSGLRHRLNFQPNRINGLAKFWEAALLRPSEFPTQSDQWFSGNLTAPRFRASAICAPQSGGAHRLVHPVWGFNRIGWKPPVRQVSAEPGVNPQVRLPASERKIASCKSSDLASLGLPLDQARTVGFGDE